MAAAQVPGPIRAVSSDTAGLHSASDWRSFTPGPIGMDDPLSALDELDDQRGSAMYLSGDFTMLKFIVNVGAEELERRIGFHAGRLAAGFRCILLAPGELLSPGDFDLKGSTRWSGGKVQQSESQAPDVEIADILQQRGLDTVEARRKVAAFFAKGGGNTPAKVVPAQRHQRWMTYPNAEALGQGIRSGIPQFTMKSGIRKRAIVL